MRLDDSPLVGSRVEREVTTVVCFAFADMVALRSLESELAGDHVHLVPGIDRDLEGMVVHLLHDTPTVLVVVHSAQLPSERLDAVLATYSAQRDRHHRLCVVEFDGDAPAAFLKQVQEAVTDMRTRIDAEPVGSAPTRSAAPATRRRPPPSTLPAAAPVSVAPEPAPPRVRKVNPIAEADSEGSSAALAVDPMTATNPGASESGTTFPDLGVSVEQVRRGQRTRSRRRRLRTTGFVAALVLSAAATVAVWSLQRGGGEDMASAPASLAPAPPARAQPSPPPPRPSPEPAPQVDPAPSAEPSASASEAAAAEARRVAAALDAGKIHALDALLVRTASRTTMSFADARKRCSKLDVAGLDGWRVPTLEELRTLRRARLLREGEYWSASWSSGGSLYTLSRDVTRPSERHRDDAESARVLCVRVR